jgi:hypothetical protein
MKHLKLIITGIILSVFAFISCNKEEINMENKGRVNVHITDAPFPIDLVSSTIVTIDAVEIRKKADAEMDDDEASFILLAEGETEIDLLELTNGITEQIASADIEAGTYDMIRLHVVNAKVILYDGTEFDLQIPSSYTSGLKVKIQPAVSISEGQTSDVLLDFDVNQSFIVKGNLNSQIGGFIFKPVVRGVYLGAAGRIEGNVSDTQGNPLENAWIKLWIPEVENELSENDSLVVSSFTDAEGNYKLIGLPANSYTLTAELEGFKADTTENISVTAGQATTVNPELPEEE